MGLFDGHAYVRSLLPTLAERVSSLPTRPIAAVVMLGDDMTPFVRQKEQLAEKLGVGFEKHIFPESITTREFRTHLNDIVRLRRVSGVVVQLPLPPHINPAVLNVIPPAKDPDFLSDRAVGMYFNGRSTIEPPTPAAIMAAISESEVELANSIVALFGYGTLVGRFLVHELLSRRALVRIVAHEVSEKLFNGTVAGANIVISAVGQAHFISASKLPINAIIIDAGFSLGVDGKVHGDIDFAGVQGEFPFVSSVPGGIGPVGVAMLYRNIVELHAKYHP